VYAPYTRTARKLIWEKISSFRGLCEGPWIFCGDFNTNRFLYERRKCITNSMTEFSDWIEDMELFNPPLYRGRFTWL